MAVKKTTGLTFGEATSKAKAGEAVARAGWSKYEMFAYITPQNTRTPNDDVEAKLIGKLLHIKEHWTLYTINNEVIPWNPYGSDVLANDWLVYEVKPMLREKRYGTIKTHESEDGNS